MFFYIAPRWVTSYWILHAQSVYAVRGMITMLAARVETKTRNELFFTQEKSVGSVYLAFSLTYNILVRQSRLQHMKNKIWRSKFPLKSWSCPIGKTMIGRHNNRILYVCVHVFMFSPVIWCPHRKLQREETKREMGVSKGSNNGFKRGVS